MICENCGNEHDGSYGSGRFCSTKCARGFSTKFNREETSRKVSEKLKGRVIGGGQFKKGYKHSDIMKQKISLGKLRNFGKNPEDLFIKNSIQTPATLKKYLIIERGYRCEECLNTEWLGKAIPLELDHCNGDTTNNEKSNLKLLCPNCHSFTPTYRGRNIKKRIPDQEVIDALKTTKSINEALNKVGLANSGKNYIRCKRLLQIGDDNSGVE